MLMGSRLLRGNPLTRPCPRCNARRPLASEDVRAPSLTGCSHASRPMRKPGWGIACGVTRRRSQDVSLESRFAP
jgi:hypothetical protein